MVYKWRVDGIPTQFDGVSVSYLTIGFKLYIFNILITLDICPFYWGWFYEPAEGEWDGFIAALGPAWVVLLA